MNILIGLVILASSWQPVEFGTINTPSVPVITTCTCFEINLTCKPGPCSFEDIGKSLMSFSAYTEKTMRETCLSILNAKCDKKFLLKVHATGYEGFEVPWPSIK